MIYAVTVYCYLGPKLGGVVRKHLVSLGVKGSEDRWGSSPRASLRLKVTQIGTTRDFFFSFGNSGS